MIRAYNELSDLKNGTIHIHTNDMYSMSLRKKDGEYQALIEISDNIPVKAEGLNGISEIWHWTCYHVFHFAIVEMGFDKIDWLSAKSIALVLTKKILEKTVTGNIPGIVVNFLWLEVVHKHVGSFAQHGANHICGTHYKANKNNNVNKRLKNRKNTSKKAKRTK